MKNVTDNTSAAGFEYPITYREFESFEELESTVDGGRATILQIVNASQRQNALQGAKDAVKKAVLALKAAEAGTDAEATEEARTALDEAVAAHQESALGYTIGKPRGGSGGGPTKATKATLGEKITEYTISNGKPPSQKELAAMMEELGIAIS